MEPNKHRAFIALLDEVEAKSERELARILGVTNTDIRRWRDGKGNPGIDVFEKLATHLGLTMDELVARLNSESVTRLQVDIAALCQQVRALPPLLAWRVKEAAEESVSEFLSRAAVSNPNLWQKYYQGTTTTMTNPDADDKSIARIINEYLERTGTDIGHLAKVAHFQPSRLEKITNGIIQPKENDIIKLARCRQFTKSDGSRWQYTEILGIFRGRTVTFETETPCDSENLEGQKTDLEDQENRENHLNEAI
jgi:transcriptional regulator with XRE-family HTH domain